MWNLFETKILLLHWVTSSRCSNVSTGFTGSGLCFRISAGPGSAGLSDRRICGALQTNHLCFISSRERTGINTYLTLILTWTLKLSLNPQTGLWRYEDWTKCPHGVDMSSLQWCKTDPHNCSEHTQYKYTSQVFTNFSTNIFIFYQNNMKDNINMNTSYIQ